MSEKEVRFTVSHIKSKEDYIKSLAVVRKGLLSSGEHKKGVFAIPDEGEYILDKSVILEKQYSATIVGGSSFSRVHEHLCSTSRDCGYYISSGIEAIREFQKNTIVCGYCCRKGNDAVFGYCGHCLGNADLELKELYRIKLRPVYVDVAYSLFRRMFKLSAMPHSMDDVINNGMDPNLLEYTDRVCELARIACIYDDLNVLCPTINPDKSVVEFLEGWYKELAEPTPECVIKEYKARQKQVAITSVLREKLDFDRDIEKKKEVAEVRCNFALQLARNGMSKRLIDNMMVYSNKNIVFGWKSLLTKEDGGEAKRIVSLCSAPKGYSVSVNSES